MKILKTLIVPAFTLLLFGCNSEGPAPTSSSEVLNPGEIEKPLFVKDLDMNVEFQIEPQRLESLIEALKRAGRNEDAERVSLTYDLSTGAVREKFLELAESSQPLKKAAVWNAQANLKYQGWLNGSMTPFVGWGVTAGNEDGSGAQNGFVKISYNGDGAGKPILSYQVGNSAGSWSTARTWNQLAGWPDASGWPTYGLWTLKITTTLAFGTNHWFSTYRVYTKSTGWGPWRSQGQTAGTTYSAGGSDAYMTGYQYKINYI